MLIPGELIKSVLQFSGAFESHVGIEHSGNWPLFRSRVEGFATSGFANPPALLMV